MKEKTMTAPIIRLRPNGDSKSGLQPCWFVDPANTAGAPPVETDHTSFTNAAGNLTADM